MTVSPGWALTYILAFVGILSSIAADAGYLVLIPLAGDGVPQLRSPSAGRAGHSALPRSPSAFTVNMLIKPLDAVLIEFTNDAIHLVDPSRSIGLTANLWFSIASVLFLTVIVALITETSDRASAGKIPYQPGGAKPAEEGDGLSADESRGCGTHCSHLWAVLAVFGLLTLPAGAPLRNPRRGH